MSIWHNAPPCNSVRRYWIFTLAASVYDASIVILKLHTKLQEHLRIAVFKQGCFNLLNIRLFWRRILTQFDFAHYLSDFVSLLLLNNRIGSGSTCICTTPQFQLFLWKTFFITHGFFCFGFIYNCFAKCHTPKIKGIIARKNIDDDIMS